MERINLLVLSDDLDLRIEIKNLINDETFAISGYSGFSAEGKTKIINKFPEVVLCAVRGEVPDSVFAFVQDLLAAVRGTIVVLANDNISVELVNKAAQYGIRKVLPIDGIGIDEFSENIGTVYKLEQQRILDTNEGKKGSLQGTRLLRRKRRHRKNNNRNRRCRTACKGGQEGYAA